MYRIKKNFGFGCMRLPMSGDEVDKVQMCQMVDAFLEAGFAAASQGSSQPTDRQ